MSSIDGHAPRKSKWQRVVFLTFMDLEFENAAKALLHWSPERFKLGGKFPCEIWHARAEGIDVYLAKAGVGLTNAASFCAVVFEFLEVDACFILGVAGALCEGLTIGEVVVSEAAAQHDSFFSGRKGIKYFRPGSQLVSKGENPSPYFAVEEGLFCFVVEVLARSYPGAYKTGVILTGSEFMCCPQRKKDVRGHFANAIAVDMETTAVMQVAEKYGVSAIAIKTISDRFDPEEGILKDFSSFVELASQQSAQIFSGIIYGLISSATRR